MGSSGSMGDLYPAREARAESVVTADSVPVVICLRDDLFSS